MTRSAPLGSNQTGNGEFTLPLAALETMPVGLLVVPGQSGTIHANAAARALLGTDDAAALPFPVEISLADDNNPAVATMQTPANGTLKLTASRVKGGGAIIVVEDNRCQIAYRQAESEYRSLVENAVCGIYRDRLDGTPLRANPALAALNGYETEAEYLAALSAAPTQWYVDAARGRQFREMMAAEGRVRDFVSEVYRHRTNEKVWITENAWYVCDAEGKPLFIEGTIQDATERVQGMTVMERQANIDALTGAASRYRFLNHLNELTQSPSAECVLLTIDLDNFKDVNDLLGHAAGDALLKTVAARLQSIVGGSALVARLGGDEFAVLLSGRHCHMEADIVALKIVNALREPVAIGGHNALVGGECRSCHLSGPRQQCRRIADPRRLRPLPGQGQGPERISPLRP